MFLTELLKNGLIESIARVPLKTKEKLDLIKSLDEYNMEFSNVESVGDLNFQEI